MTQKEFDLLKKLFVLTNEKCKSFSIATSCTPDITEQQIIKDLSNGTKKYVLIGKMSEGTTIVRLTDEGFKQLRKKCCEEMPDFSYDD